MCDKEKLVVVAYFFRFHTDDSLAGKENVRSWILVEGVPSKSLKDEGEIRLLYELRK